MCVCLRVSVSVSVRRRIVVIFCVVFGSISTNEVHNVCKCLQATLVN